jgi:hypothetical protein
MSVSSTWYKLFEDSYYRKIDVYPKLLWGVSEKDKLKDLDGNIDFSNLLYSFSKYGGPIAITKLITEEDLISSEVDKFSKSSENKKYKQNIRLFTASGKQKISEPIQVLFFLLFLSGIIKKKWTDTYLL